MLTIWKWPMTNNSNLWRKQLKLQLGSATTQISDTDVNQKLANLSMIFET